MTKSNALLASVLTSMTVGATLGCVSARNSSEPSPRSPAADEMGVGEQTVDQLSDNPGPEFSMKVVELGREAMSIGKFAPNAGQSSQRSRFVTYCPKVNQRALAGGCDTAAHRGKMLGSYPVAYDSDGKSPVRGGWACVFPPLAPQDRATVYAICK